MRAMNNRMLIELATAWELAADTDRASTAERRETLRECADMLRSLVQLDESAQLKIRLTPFVMVVGEPPALICQHCTRQVDRCPRDRSCDAGLERRLDALTDELTTAEYRTYQHRCIDVLLDMG